METLLPNSARIVMQNMEKGHWIRNLLANSKKNINLTLEGCSGFKSVTDLGADGGLNRIEYLKLTSCADLENLIAANESNKLERSEELLSGVTSSGKSFEHLRSIYIEECPKLSIIFPYNLLVHGEGLGSLSDVSVRGCDAVEHVFSTEDEEMAIESSGASLAIKSLLIEITEISLSDLPKLKSIWKGVVPTGSLHNLIKLDVCDCSLKYLLSSDMAVSIQNTEDIKVKKCYAIEELIHSQGQENGKTSSIPQTPPSPTFQNLYSLTIESCPKLKFIFSFAVAKHFNQLHKLFIDDCSGLRCVIGSVEEEPDVNEHNRFLPALQDLTMKNVQRLTSFFKGDLPIACPLQDINLKWCPNLKRFPLENVSSIKSFSKQDEWYRQLEEEDQSRLSIFQPPLKQDGDVLYSAVAGLWSDHNASQLEGITQIQQFLVKSKSAYLSEEAVYTIRLIVVPILVKLRSSPHEDTRDKVALALGNLRYFRTSRYVTDAVDDWVVPIVVKLLYSHDEDIGAMAASVLGTTAGASAECRDVVLGHGGLTALLTQLNGNSAKSKAAIFAVCEFFEVEPCMPLEQMKLALPALKSHVHSKDETISARACKALQVIADDTTEGIEAVIETGVCLRLVELLQHSTPSVVFTALDAILKIVFRHKIQSQCFIDHQVLPCLLNLLTHDHMEIIKRKACIAVNNIMDAGEEHVQAVIDAGIIGPLLHQLDSFESCMGIVALTIFTATDSGNQEHIKYLVNQGCIKKLCDLLDSTDSSTITDCLDGLDNILMVGGTSDTKDTGSVNLYALLVDESEGFKKIVSLQVHEDTDIQEKAANIVKTYQLDKQASLPSHTQLATFPIASGVFACATSSSPFQEDSPQGLVEDLEGEGGNIHVHDNTETQVKDVGLLGNSRLQDDTLARDSLGIEKNELPILSDISEVAFGFSSSYRKPLQKQGINSHIGKNSQNKNMELSSIFHKKRRKAISLGTQPRQQEGKDTEGLQLLETSKVKGNVSGTRQESSTASTITECMKILDAMDVEIADRTYNRALELLHKEEWREAFMYMSDARRKGWLWGIEAGEI